MSNAAKSLLETDALSSKPFARVELVGGPADGLSGRVSRAHWWEYYWASLDLNSQYGRRLVWVYNVRPASRRADFTEVIDLGEYP